LTPAALKLLAGKNRLIASATIVFRVAGGRPVTYVSALDVTRTTPSTAKKSARLIGVIALRL
jgi:hypothetical protein